MRGITVCEFRIHSVLASAAAVMDSCWWFLGGHAVQMPNAQEYADLIRMTPAGNQIAGPGFFGKFAEGLPTDWSQLFASDSAESPIDSLEDISFRCQGNWFDALPLEIPKDIVVVTRCVDSSYLDVFLRDDWLYEQVWFDLLNRGLRPYVFAPHAQRQHGTLNPPV